MGGNLSKTEPQADSLIGRTLDGRFQVLGRLGEGGVGVVYRARQVQLGREVAIKVLHKDAAAMPEWRARFGREARALSALAHPNVVSVTDSGIDNGVPYLVMELLQGKSLADLVKEGPLPLWRALDIARQILRGLAFAHGKGIVHRDLKPANVFLQALPDQADHVRLLDFGMVKFLTESSSRSMADTATQVGVVFGTPAYMSPEQAKAGAVDARADVYAAGVLLFQLIAGRRPFTEDTYEGVVMAHLTQPVPSIAKVRPEIAAVAPLFQPVVDKAMAKKPTARFKNADAMLAALEAAEAKMPPTVANSGRPESRRKPTPRPLRTVPPRSRFWRRIVPVTLATAAAVAVAAYFLRGGAPPVETKAPPAKPARKVAVSSPPPAPKAASSAVPATTAPALPSPRPKPEPPAAPPAKAQAPADNEGPSEKPEPEQPKTTGPKSRSRNPWKDPAPRTIRAIRDKLVKGAHMSQKALQPAYEYAHENPSDPRPWLVLGRAYAQLDWFSDAVDRYVKAYHVDSTSRGDPQMLSDLLKAAAHPTAGRAAARAIRDIYGAEAIPALDKEMKRRAGDTAALGRLTRLRESLPH